MIRIYPTIFTELADVCLVEVPDMEILTEGKNLEEAFTMARDAIGIKGITMEDDGEELPVPTRLADVDIEKGTFAGEGAGIVSLVDVDFAVYRKKLDQKMVRRNVTLPNWLNQEAEAAGVNVSKILQEALIQRLEVQK